MITRIVYRVHLVPTAKKHNYKAAFYLRGGGAPLDSQGALLQALRDASVDVPTPESWGELIKKHQDRVAKKEMAKKEKVGLWELLRAASAPSLRANPGFALAHI
jgi:hypothetical protein